jgi:hypothetical protein
MTTWFGGAGALASEATTVRATLHQGAHIDALIGASLASLGQDERRHVLQRQRRVDLDSHAARCTVAALFLVCVCVCVCVACCSHIAAWVLARGRHQSKAAKRLRRLACQGGRQGVITRSMAADTCNRLPDGNKEGADDDSDDDEMLNLLLKDKLFM